MYCILLFEIYQWQWIPFAWIEINLTIVASSQTYWAAAVIGWSSDKTYSFTVPVHSPNGMHLLAVAAVQTDCHWGLKTEEIPTGHVSPEFDRALGNPNLHFRSINHKRVMPANWMPCPYTIDSPITTRLGLCSSLDKMCFPVWPPSLLRWIYCVVVLHSVKYYILLLFCIVRALIRP